MKITDWLITAEGECQPRPAAKAWDLVRDRYYFHQFLTDIIDLLDNAPSEREELNFLPQIRMQMRQIAINSYWLTTQQTPPNPKTGAGVQVLYNEIGYPLTVQNVLTEPGVTSSIHNHGTWGVIYMLEGHEKHTFWRRINAAEEPFRIEPAGERIFGLGEIISFMPDTIHQVITLDEQPTLTKSW